MEQLDRNILILTARSREDLLKILDHVQIKEIHNLPQVRAVNLILKHDPIARDVEICKLVESAGPLLKLLDLSWTCFTGEAFTELRLELTKLETLNLWRCKLTDRGISKLLRKPMPHLKALDLSETGFTGEGLREILRNCSQLKTLNLSGNKITEEGLAALHLEPNKLETLNLGGCEKLTDSGLSKILRNFGSQLKTLDVSRTKITEEGLVYFSLKLAKLETLSLRCCEELTERGLSELLITLGPQLKSLDLNGTNIRKEGLIDLCVKLTKLETLYLGDCVYFNDSCLTELLRNPWPHLKSFNLNGNMFTGEFITGIDTKFPKLETLSLFNCPWLTNRGLHHLLNHCGPQLENLDLAHTTISGALLADWIENHPL